MALTEWVVRQVNIWVEHTTLYFLQCPLCWLDWMLTKLNRGGNSFSFLKRRIARLLPELWIFLTLYIIFQLINGVELSPRSVILNYFMLGWFSKLPYIGHLWFVTMIVACYFMFAVLEKCKNKPRTVLILALVCIAGQIALEIKRLPDYFCLVMFMCAVIFMYARLIVEYLQSKKMNWLLPISVIANLLYYWSIDEELLVIGHLPYYYGACISGLTTIVLLYFLFCKIKVGKIMALIAAYSFQIYFVHHPFARNIALFNDYSNSALLSTLCVYAISFVLAYLLKQASDGVRSKIKLWQQFCWSCNNLYFNLLRSWQPCHGLWMLLFLSK